jgi:hypothetical protein
VIPICQAAKTVAKALTDVDGDRGVVPPVWWKSRSHPSHGCISQVSILGRISRGQKTGPVGKCLTSSLAARSVSSTSPPRFLKDEHPPSRASRSGPPPDNGESDIAPGGRCFGQRLRKDGLIIVGCPSPCLLKGQMLDLATCVLLIFHRFGVRPSPPSSVRGRR